MSDYAGDFVAGSTVRLRFNTRQADGTPITLAGTPAVSVYKQGSTTESTAGVTLTTDYDSRTGYHSVSIDTSADGAFYATANDFFAVLTAGTVSGISVVGAEIGRFSLGNRVAIANVTQVGGTAQTAGDLAALLTSIGVDVDALPSAAAIAAAVLAAGDVDSYTLEQTLKLILAAVAGRLSGGGTTTNTIRAADNSKDRITATVDSDGNRTSVTLDAAG